MWIADNIHINHMDVASNRMFRMRMWILLLSAFSPLHLPIFQKGPQQVHFASMQSLLTPS
jgi:hypothetical protein